MKFKYAYFKTYGQHPTPFVFVPLYEDKEECDASAIFFQDLGLLGWPVGQQNRPRRPGVIQDSMKFIELQ
jgi:hypothetical protein